MKKNQFADNFHWPLFVSAMAILVIGLTNLFSAAFATQPGYFFSQLTWSGIAIAAGAIVYAVDYRVYERVAYILFIITLILLILVLFNRPIGGARRWIIFGALRFQPSELMKIVIVFTLARYFHNAETPRYGFDLKRLIPAFFFMLVPIGLIMLEPDLGTALLTGIIGFTIVLFAKIRFKTIVALVVVAAMLAPLGWFYVLKPYQKQRVITMFDPDSDPRGTGYHRRQSIIAIGSGQMFGKGFQSGTQTQLRFLPELHTDFIFSVWAEEQGFVGALLLLMLYASLILSGIHIASKSREKFGVLCAIGATAIIFWQVVINIGMVTGKLPTVGMTLPLMSYGGTSLVVTMVLIGLMLNIYARRRLF